MVEGTIEGDAIVCPWHESRFRLTDGEIEHGPSAMPLPVYECRQRGDDIEIRTREPRVTT